MSSDDHLFDPDVLQHSILGHVNHPNYRPVKPKVIAKKLGLPQERYRDLRIAIKKLVKRGRLLYGSNHLVRPVTSVDTREYVVGKFSRTSRGFGFVRPQIAPTRGQPGEDIYIAESKTLDAADRDLVRVKLGRGSDEPQRLRGRIVEVVQRSTRQFVGTYFESDGESFVQTSGRVFEHPIPVGDPGAKNVADGDMVVMEMLHFPSPKDEGEGVIIESLGKRGAPGVDTKAIIHEFALPQPFSEEVLRAARVEADRFDESIGDGRHDLTRETIVTIDPKDARDYDDAISLEKLENGHWLLGVHIADVSHFVRPGSVLDDEAKARSTSVYLPDHVIPMLPEIISNGLASLQPGRTRYAKSALIEMTAEGARVDVQIKTTAIASKHRFNYDEIDQYLADPKHWKTTLDRSVCGLLDRMHQLAMLLRRRRLDRGAIELTLPEIKIDFDAKGCVSGAHKVEHTVSHQIIEEFMLTANEAVAELLDDRKVRLLRRIHEPPDARKLRALNRFLQELGIECESMESRHEINRVVQLVHGQPEEFAVNLAILKSMQKAVYSPLEEGHYALNSQHYCHFTSPIRRYPDLIVHRLLHCLERGQPADDALEKLIALGEHCSDGEQRAERAERELVKLKLLGYMSRRIGKRYVAMVTGVERFGFFAQGVDLPAEGLVPLDSLVDDQYIYDSDSHTLSGHGLGNEFRLGDLVELEVTNVNLDRREMEWSFVKHMGHPPKRESTRPKKQTKSRPRSGRRRRGRS